MKIGIFGGSFNPPHNMHLNIAKNILKEKIVDQVIFVPTGSYYPKKGLISIKDRYNMLCIMTKKHPNIKVSYLSKSKKYEYTYQVLDYFQKKYKESEIYFILGGDNLEEIATWKNFEYILGNYKLIIARRKNYDLDKIINKYKKYSHNFTISNIEESSISSTIIRNNLDLESSFLNEGVLKYIKKHRLYL